MSCFSLSKSIYCPSYNGYNFKELSYGELVEVPVSVNSHTLDSAIETSLRIHYDYLEKCNLKGAVENIPLYSTWLCASIAEKSQVCNTMERRLCSSTCFKFLEEFSDYTSGCSRNAKVIKIKRNIMTYCESLIVNTNGNDYCVSNKNKKKSCGLRTFADICNNCNKNACSGYTSNVVQSMVTSQSDGEAKYQKIKKDLIISGIVIGSLIGLALLFIALRYVYVWVKTRRIWKKAKEEKNRFDEIQVSPVRKPTQSSIRLV
eukprot:NODE_292_length_11597_cov_0.265177.p4 type:complete len:260 gc:universal NODE_292_length_11597_cov_0.265177:8263-7484(-)